MTESLIYVVFVREPDADPDPEQLRASADQMVEDSRFSYFESVEPVDSDTVESDERISERLVDSGVISGQAAAVQLENAYNRLEDNVAGHLTTLNRILGGLPLADIRYAIQDIHDPGALADILEDGGRVLSGAEHPDITLYEEDGTPIVEYERKDELFDIAFREEQPIHLVPLLAQT